jgi:hypothetical protein
MKVSLTVKKVWQTDADHSRDSGVYMRMGRSLTLLFRSDYNSRSCTVLDLRTRQRSEMQGGLSCAA